MNSNIALTEAVYYILLSLLSPLHGYGIMLTIEEKSNGRVKLAPGTLYGALSSLVEKGWIEVHSTSSERGKKEYVITPNGMETLQHELQRLKELVKNGELLLKED
ncbi:MAG: PadR family transcriptional regulator [Bacilli bacterium]